tara:strand:+ start:115 stop:741 length:627 start_codon:yes stop_codon:yes gene_type:complete
MFAIFNEVTRNDDGGFRGKISGVHELCLRRDSIESLEHDGFCFADDFEGFDTERVLIHVGLSPSWHRVDHETRLRFDMWALFKVTLSSGREFEVIADYWVAPPDKYEFLGDHLYQRGMYFSLCMTSDDTNSAIFHFPASSDGDSRWGSWFNPNQSYSPQWSPKDYFDYRSHHFDLDADELYKRWTEDGSPDRWSECRAEDGYDYRGGL